MVFIIENFKTYIINNLVDNLAQFIKFFVSALILFVSKFNISFWFYINYKYFNNFIIKNWYLILFICKFFYKLDFIIVYYLKKLKKIEKKLLNII